MTENGDTNPHEEPCLSCGEETAIGSIFFSDRHENEGPDGRVYLCSECVARIRMAGHSEDLTSIRTVGDLALIGFNAGGSRG
jgi:hypothetical protein